MRIFLCIFLLAPQVTYGAGSSCPVAAIAGKWKFQSGSVAFRHANGRADTDELKTMDLNIESSGSEIYRVSLCSAADGSGMGRYNCHSGDFQIQGSNVVALNSVSSPLGKIGKCQSGRLEFGYDSRATFWKGAVSGGSLYWTLFSRPEGLVFQLRGTIEGETMVLKSQMAR